MPYHPPSSVQDLYTERNGSRITDIQDVIVYPRARVATCNWCLRKKTVRSVEASFRTTRSAREWRWAHRQLCRECLDYIIHLADGKITYCAF